jgi:pimeloyl-ACP methyl ester carboxylesterase
MNDTPIVLIHGLWMTPRSWEGWVDRFGAAGHETVAPPWPGVSDDVEGLRADPSPIARLTVREIVDHYAGLIEAMDRPPIIIGHSFGGLFTQLLLDRGLGAAGVALGPAPIKGILSLPFSSLRSAWPAVRNPANRHKAVRLSLKQFHYRFTNHLTVEQSRPLYDRYYIPGAGHLLFEAAFANLNRKSATAVNLRNDDRAPLLLVAGGIDHISPPSLVRTNAEKYKHARAITEYRSFPGRSHFTAGQDGWEDVADFALSWAVTQSERLPVTVASRPDLTGAA